MANEYSSRWFSTFLDTVPEEWTAKEVEGITAALPLPDFSRVLDVCCGSGRHAVRLVAAGYDLVGVDRSAEAVSEAAARVPGGRFVVADQRELASLGTTFDAVLILWQSFGYFDSATNDQVLHDVAALLRPGGRLLVDLYHPGYVRRHLGTQTKVRGEGCRSINNEIRNGRLVSTINYRNGAIDVMDFELYEPNELVHRASAHGLQPIQMCAWWDPHCPPSSNDQRYQVVFENAVSPN